jgi:phosphatidate cytidylyltransferase
VVVMLLALFVNGYVFSAFFLLIMAGGYLEYVRLMKSTPRGNTALRMVAGVFYLCIPMLMLIDLGTGLFRLGNVNAYSPVYPCAVIFSIWINDTMAYIVGSFIGKTPFSKISPKKTWEGTIGGAVLCVGVMTALAFVFPEIISPARMAVIALLCAVFGTLGDLFESRLKRRAGVKDSGNILPGHGGFLDRFDSLLLATPPVWIFVNCTM